MPATVKVDDDPCPVLLQHNVGRRNVVMDQTERMEVLNTTQYAAQLRLHRILDKRPSAKQEGGFVQMLRVDFASQCRDLSLEAEAGYSSPSFETATVGGDVWMRMFPKDFARLNFTKDPSLEVWRTGIVEKAWCLDIAALLRCHRPRRLHFGPSTVGLHSFDVV